MVHESDAAMQLDQSLLQWVLFVLLSMDRNTGSGLHLFTELFHKDFSSLIRTNAGGIYRPNPLPFSGDFTHKLPQFQPVIICHTATTYNLRIFHV